MNIIVENRQQLDYFSDYFDYNKIDFIKKSFWTCIDKSENISEHIIPDNLYNTLCILDMSTVIDILHCDLATSFLEKFLHANNMLWVATEIDASLGYLRNKSLFEKLDNLQNKKNVVLWLDSDFTVNLNFKYTRYNTRYYTFLTMPRIQDTKLIKNLDSKDYLLTTITKNHARKLLVDEIHKRPGLLENSIVKAQRKKDYNNWIGNTPQHHNWFDGHLSTDLYTNSWLELVPETSITDHYFITEKTVKPIVAKTPFLILSTPGYLEYLQSIGFKTFNSVVNESYDAEQNLEIRIKMILDVLENIIKNGAENFYKECDKITEHNFNKLCEISAKKVLMMDNLIHDWILDAKNQLTSYENNLIISI